MHLLCRGPPTPRTSSERALWDCAMCPSARLGAAVSPKGNFSLTLPFSTTEPRHSMGPSAHKGNVILGVWQITAGSVMPCLLSQHLRIL